MARLDRGEASCPCGSPRRRRTEVAADRDAFQARKSVAAGAFERRIGLHRFPFRRALSFVAVSIDKNQVDQRRAKRFSFNNNSDKQGVFCQ
jgi:hypothetical protein